MSDSLDETKREFYDIMQQMRHEHFSWPPPEGLTLSEARALMAIGHLEDDSDDVRAGKIAEMAHITPSSLSQTLKVLEYKGFIERHRSHDDNRAVSVSLTAKGEEAAREGKRIGDEHMDAVISFVGLEDMRHLVRIMRKILEFHEHEKAKQRLHFGRYPARPVPDEEGPSGAAEASAEGDDAPCA